MLDGIVEQLEAAWESGIRAYDCVHKEYVLMIPSVVALLGDNPMQSELSCHVGLMGKYFCRVCQVKGFDTSDQPSQPSQQEETAPHGENSEAETASEVSDAGSELLQVKHGAKGRKKANETLHSMVERVKRFLKRGEPRTKRQTLNNLQTMARDAKIVGNQTKIKMFKTSIGIKDNFLEHFMGRMQSSYAKITGHAKKQDTLERFLTTLPEDLFSPVWRIAGLDPHSDTPVEILHVILLGFVKYFWRDVVQNQIKKNSPEQDTLITRLDCFDVSGLNMSKLSGQTLVQYAGSLTGRDFRAIAQAAPFVLQGLVSSKCYSAWVGLANLIPLVWQPLIDNIDSHVATLDAAIQDFLLRVTIWTPRWFNKPKFHILLHLPEHIRRFGPAILFATEGFESFNAVIRAKSVHSNRQAPSRDIAKGFAQGSRIRHFMSGGPLFTREHTVANNEDSNEEPQRQHIPGATVGTGPLGIIAQPNIITDYLGHQFSNQSSRGYCHRGEFLPVPFESTQVGMKLPHLRETAARCRLPNFSQADLLLQRCQSSILHNGDTCQPGSWVLIRDSNGRTILASVVEIVQIEGTLNHGASRPDFYLVQHALNEGCVHPYEMPLITLQEDSYDVMDPVERQITSQTRMAVSHNNPHDIVLNTAQMRDSFYLGIFRKQPEHRTEVEKDNMILEASTREIDCRKERGDQQSRAHGRGRGLGVGRGRGRGRGGRGGHLEEQGATLSQRGRGRQGPD
ncbi:hypothetical protein H0H93_013289 [Arthromyces matolae]|nr:hypothetical protein H0H93_013289 [Arthromyces matolae]